MDNIYQILKEYWGYESFRSIQKDIILSVLEGKDTLALMPTGGGKSLTYQVPALASEGICIVITPLISLMLDQVEQLRRRDIKAAAVHAGLGKREVETILENAVHGAYKFLYLSPERLQTFLFREKVKNMPVNLIAVDEAHCISQWGYDFRPSYMQIASIRNYLKNIPLLALTATATNVVVDDIQDKLNFSEKNVIKTDFSRPNLVYYVRKSEGKLNDLLKMIESIRGSGVVYTKNRRKTKEVAQFLSQNNISADYYHAGLSYAVRQEKQLNWTKNKTRIMVATNAFGMGIDKPDVRLVVHTDLPDSPEAYFQEAGRAGRDGKKAFAVLLAQNYDKTIAASRLSTTFPELQKVTRIYEAVCNYLEVPIGSGSGMAYDFNLQHFSTTFKFNSLEVFNSLKILEQQGYIDLTDELNNPSRLMFTVNRDDLYRFQVANFKYDGFIKLILRSYTGLFTEYAVIDEEMLSHRANISRDMVYEYLKKLSSLKMINYIPAKKSPLIVFIENRLETNAIFISKENYADRKMRYEERLNAMINYAFDTETCRSIQLLKYFGQKEAEECGLCDVCKSKDALIPYNAELANQLIDIVKDKPVLPGDIYKLINEKHSLVKRHINMLMDQEKIAYNTEGEIIFNDK